MEKFILRIPEDNSCLVVRVNEVFNEGLFPACKVEDKNGNLVLTGEHKDLVGIKREIRSRLEHGIKEARKDGHWKDVGYLISGCSSLSSLDILLEQ